MPGDAQQLPTLSDDDQAALQRWVRKQGLGSTVSDVQPLTGGTQNIVVRLQIDGRPMVLRRPPVHPRPTSDKTMLREIAALSTLTGTPVPHPGFIAGCDDLDVLGVVFYLMELVDGFNPGDDMDDAYVRDSSMRHQVGLSYAASLAQLGNVAWEGSPLAELKRPGSFLERQVPQFLRLLESYRHEGYDPESLAVTELAEWLASNRPPDGKPGILHGDPHLSNVLLRRDRPELAAFVDWEMCTIGDPLLDLGWMLICWPLDTYTITAGAATRRTGRTGQPPRAPRRLPRCGRARNVNAQLVRRDGVLQAGHCDRGHLVPLSGGSGQPRGGGGTARVGAESHRRGYPGCQGRQPVRAGLAVGVDSQLDGQR